MLAKEIDGTEGEVPEPGFRLIGLKLAAVAVNAMDAGPPAAFVATFNYPEKLPGVLEVKATVMVQLAPMASVVPQVVPETVTLAALVPLSVMLLIVAFALPVLVRVAVSGSACEITVL